MVDTVLPHSGMAGGLRAVGPKADLALIYAPDGAVAAGVFTTNVMCAAPVTYCREILALRDYTKAVRDNSPLRCCTEYTLPLCTRLLCVVITGPMY